MLKRNIPFESFTDLLRGEVNYLSNPADYQGFEDAYIALRGKEGRIYADDVLEKLPEVTSGHPLFQEWQIRKQSLQKLMRYLEKQHCPLAVLDLGCGNGWMSANLARIPHSTIYGVDLNDAELKQGAAVFSHQQNLFFCYGDIFQNIFPKSTFDVIVLASCIQYFPDFTRILETLMPLLTERGELHILDSPFYQSGEIPTAAKRTAAYYRDAGFPGMAGYYYHHSTEEIATHGGRYQYDPQQLSSKLQRKFFSKYQSPFPWLIFSK